MLFPESTPRSLRTAAQMLRRCMNTRVPCVNSDLYTHTPNLQSTFSVSSEVILRIGEAGFSRFARPYSQLSAIDQEPTDQ